MFERVISLIGKDNLDELNKMHCLIVGVGGVGATVAESLVRSGIGSLTLIDYDLIEESNLNRQIMTDTTNIGQKKVEVLASRLKKINPQVNIKALSLFLNEENITDLKNYDYIIDACDTVKTKILLLQYAQEQKIKIITCLGMGKRIDPTQVKMTTLNKTYNDPLAKVLRQQVKKTGLSLNTPVVFSSELPLNQEKTIASMMMVPSTAGLVITSFIIQDILKNK